MTVVTLRPLRAGDLDAIIAIDAQVYPEPWSRALLVDQIDRDDRLHLVAEQDDAVVGHGAVLFLADDAHITTIAVDPARQGEGIATELLVALARHAVAAGSEGLTLEVRVGNEPALALYRRFGFAPAGIRAGYYQSDGEDAMVMWAHNIGAPAYLDRLARIETRRHRPEAQHV